MDLNDRVVVVTGGGNGIGRALVTAFAAAGARGIVVGDINVEWAEASAARVNGIGVACDVGDHEAIEQLVRVAEQRFGPVDVFCSNAGYSDPAPGDLSQSIDAWERITRVNQLAHVWAARAVVPSMLERGGGYLLQTISSAALITGPSAPGYTMTKHGALGFAEWLSLQYGSRGVRVSCLCPNAVYTGMFGRTPDDGVAAPPDLGALGEALMPEEVAAQAIAVMTTTEPFLILPHDRVRVSFARKGEDYEGWLTHTRGRLAKMRATESG